MLMTNRAESIWIYAKANCISQIGMLKSQVFKELGFQVIIYLDFHDFDFDFDLFIFLMEIFWFFSGYGLESLITTKIRMPNAIVVDSQERKFYWADARLDKIELVYLDNMDRIGKKHALKKYNQFLLNTSLKIK